MDKDDIIEKYKGELEAVGFDFSAYSLDFSEVSPEDTLALSSLPEVSSP